VAEVEKNQSEAERQRSKFRHDIRTSFNVLIGYSEICLEEVSLSHANLISDLNQFIQEIRAAFRDTEYAIERASLDTEELFKVEVSNWLKSVLILAIQKLASLRARMEIHFLTDENWKNVDRALKHLTLQCLNPFSDLKFARKAVIQKTQIDASSGKENSNFLGKILLVDDQSDNLFVLRHKLERLNCNVTALTSPLLALKLLQENFFDVILVDLQMPEMSGLDFLTAVMANPLTKDIPVLLITASDDTDILSECINRGAVDFLPKPVESSILKARVLSCLERKMSRDRERQISTELAFEKARVDELLGMILPHETVKELKETGGVVPRRFTNVAVLFCDVVSFTPYCETHPPEEIIAHLHSLFSEFDAIAEINGMQKIKTIGDSYMAAGGLLRPLSDPLLSAIHAGFDMIDAASIHPSGWQVRVGVHIGDVVAGIVGTRQYLFDLWGDTVNTAARVEGAGAPMSVTVLKKLISNRKLTFAAQKLGSVELKGKGDFELTTLTRASVKPK
jgi:class 3 adenylate cyclase